MPGHPRGDQGGRRKPQARGQGPVAAISGDKPVFISEAAVSVAWAAAWGRQAQLRYPDPGGDLE